MSEGVPIIADEVIVVPPQQRSPRHVPRRVYNGSAIRVILVRHGRPAIAINPRTSHHGFRDYIDAYEAAGLDPMSAPPEELQDLVKELAAVYTSGRPRSHDSARALAPNAELIADPLFVEAPLASPRIPLLRLSVPSWAVMSRILWHAGYHPEIENYRKAKQRAAKAADILAARAGEDGATALVAHGYFNAIIGRETEAPGISQDRFASRALLERRGLRTAVRHRSNIERAVTNFGTDRAQSCNSTLGA